MKTTQWLFGEEVDITKAPVLEEPFIIVEMEMCRKYCSAINREREKIHTSKKYPLITARVNRYFTKEFRDLIAQECNLVGYGEIASVEYLEEKDPNEESGIIEVWVDDTKSQWQEEIYQDRVKKREENEIKKMKDLK